MRNFELIFSSEEFDSNKFVISPYVSRITYVSPVKITEGGAVYDLYRFRSGESSIRFSDGGSASGDILIALNDPPGEGPFDGQGAKVFVLGRDGNLEPVGRALLKKIE